MDVGEVSTVLGPDLMFDVYKVSHGQCEIKYIRNSNLQMNTSNYDIRGYSKIES